MRFISIFFQLAFLVVSSTGDETTVSIVSTLTNGAVDLAEGGELSRSLELFKQASNVDPQNGKAVLNVGVALLRLGRLTEAREYLERAGRLLGTPSAGLLDNLRALDEYENWQRLHPGSSGVDADADEDENSYEDDDGDPALATRLTETAISFAEGGSMVEALDLFSQVEHLSGPIWIHS